MSKLKTIYLHGRLKKLGASFKFDVKNAAEAVCALKSQVKGFIAAIRKGKYVVIMGKKASGVSLDVDELGLRFGMQDELHIVPFVRGAGGRAMVIVKVVLGVALLAVGIGGAFLMAAGPGAIAAWGGTAFSIAGQGITWGSLAITGLAVTLAGVAGALTPKATLTPTDYESRESPEDRPSYIFNGAVNRSEEGSCVPILYGKFLCGSVVISTGVSAEAV